MDKSKPRLLGFGMDDDGHIRVTKAPDYHLQGGSKDTHELLQKIAAKTNEALKAQGHTIQSAEPDRLGKTINDVAQRITEEAHNDRIG